MTSLARAAARHPRHVLLAALVGGLLSTQAPRAAAVLAGLPLLGAGVLSARKVGAPSPVFAVAGVMVVAGFVVGAARVAAMDRTALAPLIGRSVALRAIVLERPRASVRRNLPAWALHAGGSAREAAALAEISSGAGRGERIVVRAARWPAVRPGLEVAVSGRLADLGRADGWQRRRGAHARVFAGGVRLTDRARGGLAGMVDRLRTRAEEAVTSGLDPPRAALARGMVLGEDDALSPRTRDDFRASGLAHLVAASGQNVALLAALALPILAALGFGLRGRLVGALLLIALYVPLAGAGPSIQRAGVMGAAGLVAALAGRPASRAYALLLAAAVTLILNPRASSDPGWQLSFAAVAAIAVLASPVARRLATRGVARPAAEAGALTLSATLATAPLLALHFGRVSLVSLPANLLAAAAVAPVMWLGMLAIGAGLVVPAAATLIDALAQYPLAFVGWVASAAARVPAASVSASPLVVTAAAAIASLALFRWTRDSHESSVGWLQSRRSDRPPGGLPAPSLARTAGARDRPGWTAGAGDRPGRFGWTAGPGDRPDRSRPGPGRRRLVWAIGAAAAAAVLGFGPVGCAGGHGPPDPRDLVVSFLDVGQGDATLVQHAGATVLIDTGPPGGPLLRRLDEAGVRRVDLLVVTHAQVDHDGEAAAVLDRYPVGLLLDGGDGVPGYDRPAIEAALARRRVRRVVPDVGQVLRAGPTSWTSCGRGARPPAPTRARTPTSARSSPTCATATSTSSCPPTPSRTSPRPCPCPPSRR